MTILNLQVTASADDADESLSGSMNVVRTVVRMRNLDNWGGFRFQNVTIPPGATINSASWKPYLGSAVTDDWDHTVYGEDVDDSAAFTTSADNISGRTLTSASTTITVTGVGTGRYTVDVTSIIQEIVDRAGWASGNDLAILVRGLSSAALLDATSYDGSTTNAALLDIDYTESGGEALEVQDITTPGNIDNVLLAGIDLVIQDVSVAGTIDTVLLAGIDLVIQDIITPGTIDNVTLGGAALAVEDLTAVGTIDPVLLTGIDLAIQDIFVASAMDNLLLTGIDLVVQDTAVVSTLDHVLLTGIDLTVQDVVVGGTIDTVFLGGFADIEATRLRVFNRVGRVMVLISETAVQVRNNLTRVGKP